MRGLRRDKDHNNRGCAAVVSVVGMIHDAHAGWGGRETVYDCGDEEACSHQSSLLPVLDLDALNAVNIVALFIGGVVWLLAGRQQVGSVLSRHCVCVVPRVLRGRQGVGRHLHNER